MSVEGSTHLGPDEAIKRQNAELLQADIADLVLFLVSAYANKILPQLLPHLPYTLPPSDVAHNISKQRIVQDTIMGWATEALERAGVPQPQRPAGKAGPVFDFDGLVELGHGDAKVCAGLENAELMVRFAGAQLAAISPDDPTAQKQARQALNRAISLLLEASARLMQLDAVHAAATEAVENPRAASRDIFATTIDEAIHPSNAEASSDPTIGPEGARTREALGILDPTGDIRAAERRAAAWIDLEGLYDASQYHEEVLGNPQDPAAGQGRVAPTHPFW